MNSDEFVDSFSARMRRDQSPLPQKGRNEPALKIPDLGLSLHSIHYLEDEGQSLHGRVDLLPDRHLEAMRSFRDVHQFYNAMCKDIQMYELLTFSCQKSGLSRTGEFLLGVSLNVDPQEIPDIALLNQGGYIIKRLPLTMEQILNTQNGIMGAIQESLGSGLRILLKQKNVIMTIYYSGCDENEVTELLKLLLRGFSVEMNGAKPDSMEPSRKGYVSFTIRSSQDEH